MKTNMWSNIFWIAAVERAIKTVAQTAVALIGTTALIGQVDWLMVASAAGLAGLLSILTSVASDAATGTGPSLGSGERVTVSPRRIMGAEGTYGTSEAG